MTIWARILGAVPKAERDGIRLREENPWRMTATRDVSRFVRALPLLAPEGAIAYFEGTGETHVAEYLASESIVGSVRVAVGTIWPKPDTYHVLLTATSMERLAAFLDARPAGYVCSHCHVYQGTSVLLEWHDAFGDDPMYISSAVPEEVVAALAGALGSSYGTGWAG